MFFPILRRRSRLLRFTLGVRVTPRRNPLRPVLRWLYLARAAAYFLRR